MIPQREAGGKDRRARRKFEERGEVSLCHPISPNRGTGTSGWVRWESPGPCSATSVQGGDPYLGDLAFDLGIGLDAGLPPNGTVA